MALYEVRSVQYVPVPGVPAWVESEAGPDLAERWLAAVTFRPRLQPMRTVSG